jgi:class 3 adenylate cyclase
VNTWGDAIVACFEDANAGLRCACQLVMVLQAAGIHTRIGMSRGQTLVRGNPLTDRLDIEGDSVNFAARLEPLAEQGEVLITEELRYHPEVKQDHFIFTHQRRSLKKAVGGQQQSDMIECYGVKLREDGM